MPAPQFRPALGLSDHDDVAVVEVGEVLADLGEGDGIVGARLYHVITDYQLYFGPGRQPLNALKIWEGGLGVWGAIAFGLLGGYLVARRRRIAFPAVLDAIAPAILVAQAIGRLGNWFNQELFGRPTTLPWGLEIAPQYRPPGYSQFATFHPTFLYEMLWNLAAAVLLVWLDRRFRLGHGKVFALYVLLYCGGRFWIEALRIDTVNEIGGFRLNNYTALIGFIVALVWLIWLIRNRPGREEIVEGIGMSAEPAVAGSAAEMTSGDAADAADPESDETPEQEAASPASDRDPTAAG